MFYGTTSSTTNTVNVPAGNNYTFSSIVFNSGTTTINGPGTLTGSASTTALHSNNDNATIGAVLAGGSGVTYRFRGGSLAGSVKLTGNNTYTGPTQVRDDGTLQVEGELASPSIDVESGSALTFGGSVDRTYSGEITGEGRLNKTGPGTLTLTGANTYSGTTQVQAGKLAITKATGLGASTSSAFTSVLSNATLEIQGVSVAERVGLASGATLSATGTSTLSGQLELTNTGTRYLSPNSGAVLTLSGAISGAVNMNLRKTGAGTVVLSGNSSAFEGGVEVEAGTLLVNGTLATTGAVRVKTGATLGGSSSTSGRINQSVTLDSGSKLEPGSATTVGKLIAGASTTSTFSAAGDLNFQLGQAGTVGGTLNDLVEVTGNLSLTGSTVNISQSPGGTLGVGTYTLFTYTGTLTGLPSIGSVPSGMVATVSSDATTNPKRVTLTVARKVLYWAPSTTFTNCTLPLSNLNLGGNGTWGTGNNWCPEAGGAKVAWAAGSHTVFAGTGGTATVSGSPREVASITFDAAGFTLSGLSLYGTETNSPIVLHSSTSDTGVNTINNVLGGGGVDYEKTGAGTIVLGGNSTYTGETTVKGGTLAITHANALGTTAGGTTVNGSTAKLELRGVAVGNEAVTLLSSGTLLATAGNSSLSGTVALGTSSTKAIEVGSAAELEVSGVISGTTAPLSKKGDGTLVLTAANTYEAATTVSAGTLAITDGGALGTTDGATTVSAGAKLELRGVTTAEAVTLSSTTTSFAVLSATGSVDSNLSGAVALGTGSASFREISVDSGRTLTLSGVITGTSGALKKAGTGTLVISGSNNDHTGLVNVTEGKLLVNGSLATGTSAVTVSSGATLGGSGTINRPVTMTTTATLEPGGANAVGTLTIGSTTNNRNFTASGAASLNFQLGEAGTVGTLNDHVIVNGNLTLNSAGKVNISQSSGGTLGPGVYTLFKYTGTFTGSLPATVTGVPAGRVATLSHDATAKEVKLTVAGGGKLYWAPSASITNCTLPLSNLALGGAGTWNASNQNWCPESGGAKVAWVADSTAVFAGTGAAVSISGTHHVSGLTFEAAGFTLSGGTLTGAGSPTVLHSSTSATDTTISSVLAGTDVAYEKTGTGTIVLGGTNTYTGATTVSAGTLSVGSGSTTGSISNTSGVEVSNGATLHFNRSNGLTFSKVISGEGSLKKSGAGILTLSADNTYTGSTLVEAGTLRIGAGGTTGSMSSTSGVSVSSGAYLRFVRSDDVTFDKVISGEGSLETYGGAVTLTGANTYTGTTTVSAGTLSIGSGSTTGAIGSTSGVAVSGGATLQFNRSDAVTFSPVISGAGALQQSGTGTLTLTGTNTHSGVTTVSAGTLSIGSGSTTGSIGDTSGVAVSSGATLQFNRSDAVTFSPVISGEGALQQSGTGTLTLTATNTHTGAATVSAGTLLVNGSLASSTSLVTVSSGATLGGAGTINRPVTLESGSALEPGNATAVGTLTTSGAFSAAGNLNFQLAQAGVAGGSNDLVAVTGNLTLTGSTVNISHGTGGTLAAGDYVLFTYSGTRSGDLPAVGSGVPANLEATVSEDTTVSPRRVMLKLSPVALLYWAPDSTTCAAGTFGGNNTWNTAATHWCTDVDGTKTTWVPGAAAVFRDKASTVAVSGAQDFSRLTFEVSNVTLSGDTLTGVSGPSNATNTVLTSATGVTGIEIGNVLAGSLPYRKEGAGIVILKGANTYTSTTTVAAGTLAITNANGLGTTGSGTTVNALNNTAATLELRGVAVGNEAVTLTNSGTLLATAGNSSLSGTVALGTSSTKTIEVGSGSQLTISGVISGTTAPLSKTGDGTLVLTAANTYEGKTRVTAGVLQFGDNTATGSANSTSGIEVSEGARLVFNRSADFTFNRSVSGAGVLAQEGTGRVFINGDNTYTGATTLAANTSLFIGNNGTAGSINNTSEVQMATGAALIFNRSDSLTFAPAISGAGRLEKLIAASTVTLTGANTYTGTTTVTNGTLLVNGSLSSGTSAVTVNSGATLGGRGTISRPVELQGMASLQPGSATAVGTLTANALTLSGDGTLHFQLGQAGTVGGTLNDHVVVNGDLVLGSAAKFRITQSPGGTLAAGTYTLFKYSGSLTGPLMLDTMPNGLVATLLHDEAGKTVKLMIEDLLHTVSGTVFNDGGAPTGGASTGVPNNGLRDGAEAGLARVAVNLTDCGSGTVLDSTVSDAAGAWTLAVPKEQVDAGTQVCVAPTLPEGHTATGASVGGTATPDGAPTTVGTVSYTYSRAGHRTSLVVPASGTVTQLNFGSVPASRLQAAVPRTGAPGGYVVHAHQFTAGTAGSVAFSTGVGSGTAANEGWRELVYLDPGCQGTLQPNATLLHPPTTPQTVVQGQTVCFVVQQFIAGSAQDGQSRILPVRAQLSFANAPGLSATYTLEDGVTVAAGQLRLLKEVRVGAAAWSTSNEAKPGQELEYRITISNQGTTPISSVSVSDITPAYTTFKSATVGTLPPGLSACSKTTPVNAAVPVACTEAQGTTGGSGQIRWSFSGELHPGASVELNYVVDVQ